MKIIKITFLVLLCLGALLFVSLFFIVKNFDISHYKDEITEELNAALGMDIHIEDIMLNFSIQDGVDLVVDGLTVRDDTAFWAGNIFEADNLSMDVDLLALVHQRKLMVKNVQVNSPRLVVVRSPDGQTNVQAIVQKNAVAEPSNIPTPVLQREYAEKRKELSFLLIKSMKVNDGKVVFIDKTVDPQTMIETTKIDLSINQFSLVNPFTFILKSSLMSDVQNIQVKGQVTLDIPNSMVETGNVSVRLDLSQFRLARIAQIFPSAEVIKMIEKAEGQVDINIARLVVGKEGLIDLMFFATLDKGFLSVDQIASEFRDISASIKGEGKEISVSDYSFDLADGTVSGKANLSDYAGDRDFDFTISAKNLRLEKLIPKDQIAVEVRGLIQSRFDLSGRMADPSAVLKTLAGGGNVTITDGKLVNLNILRIVLGKISMIPGLLGTIDQNLPDKYKVQVKNKHTKIEKISVDADIKEELVYLKDIVIKADSFVVQAEGELDFEKNIDFRGEVFVPQDLSKALVSSAGELQALMDENEQLYIPLAPYRGKINSIKFYPALAYLGKKFIVDRGKKELKNVLEKALDLGGQQAETSAPATEEGAQGQPQETEKRPEEILIENVLDTIFQ